MEGSELRRRTREEWAAIMQAHAGSGGSAARYCREHEIDYKRFLYHRRKFKRANHHIQGNVERSGKKSFIPISVSQAGSIRIRLSEGITVETDRMPEVDWLVELTSKIAVSGGSGC